MAYRWTMYGLVAVMCLGLLYGVGKHVGTQYASAAWAEAIDEALHGPLVAGGGEEPLDFTIGAARKCVVNGGDAYRSAWRQVDREAKIYRTCTTAWCTVWYFDRTVGTIKYCADSDDFLANDWGCSE